jgi:binding-protein-dependent transport system inner membrane component
MAVVVASLAWLYPTRTIRAQVLSLRERGYVEVARLSGMSGPAIIFFELMPIPMPNRGPDWAPTRGQTSAPIDTCFSTRRAQSISASEKSGAFATSPIRGDECAALGAFLGPSNLVSSRYSALAVAEALSKMPILTR